MLTSAARSSLMAIEPGVIDLLEIVCRDSKFFSSDIVWNEFERRAPHSNIMMRRLR